ncbi:MAG: hypothetical protein ACK5D5_08275 [Bacteroidota bacterium]
MNLKKIFLPLNATFYICIFSIVSCKEKSKISSKQSESKNQIAIENVVNSPFKKVNVPLSIYTIDPSKDVTLVTQSGSKIHIGSNSIVDKDGNKVTGSVKIKYREFKDAAEIMSAGIPMSFKNDPSGQNKCFQSAGMFEILGENNEGKAVFIDKEKPIKVELTSNNTGDGYSNFYLNQKTGDWIYSGEERKTPNLEKLNLNAQIKKLKVLTAFNGKDYFALNSMGLLDAFFNDDYEKIMPYYSKKNKALPEKLLRYGIKSENIYSNDEVSIGRNEYPASMVIWENINHTKFPSWTKDRRAEVTKISGDVYEITVSTDRNNKTIFRTKVRAVMSIKSMVRFSPEHWTSKYQETMEEIKKQEETLAKMSDMYRVLEVNSFGIHNCDKFYSKPESFAINAKIILPKSENNFKPERLFYVSAKDKVTIDYKLTDIVKMTIYPDSTASIYTVLENDMLAKIGSESLLKLNKANSENKEIKMEFKPLRKVSSVDDLKECIGLK